MCLWLIWDSLWGLTGNFRTINIPSNRWLVTESENVLSCELKRQRYYSYQPQSDNEKEKDYLLDPIFLTHLYHIVCLIYWVLWCLCYLRQLIKQQRLITCQINMNLWRMYQRCHCFSFKWNDFFLIQFWFQCQYNVLSNVIVINIKKNTLISIL